MLYFIGWLGSLILLKMAWGSAQTTADIAGLLVFAIILGILAIGAYMV